MKITISDIGIAYKTLQKVRSNVTEFKLAYRIQKVMDKVASEMKRIDEFRNSLYKKYGEKDEKNPNMVTIPPAKEETFMKEMDEFLKDDTDLNIQQVPFELLDQSKISLSPDEVSNISKFIAEPIDPNVQKK